MWNIQHIARTASTNADLAQLAAEGAAEGTVLVADHQEAGRGRLGRAWHTPRGLALTVSFLLRPVTVPVSRWSWLPLLAGVAVVDGVADATHVEARLKWPNDVLVPRDGDRKLAGILVERIDTESGAAAVVGIGLNVLQGGDDLPPNATSLALAGAENVTRAPILDAIAGHLADMYQLWRTANGDPKAGLAAAYLKRCATIGRRVTVALPGGDTLVGDAVDVDELGRLVVDTGGSRTAVGAGDIVHVRRADLL